MFHSLAKFGLTTLKFYTVDSTKITGENSLKLRSSQAQWRFLHQISQRDLYAKNQFSTTSTKIFPVYCLIENIYISPGLLHSLVCFYSISGTV